MTSYNNPSGDGERDRDLEDWLHLTGWHNVRDREKKLEQYRDIHYEYEMKRRDLMRGTFDELSQSHHHDAESSHMGMNPMATPYQPAAASAHSGASRVVAGQGHEQRGAGHHNVGSSRERGRSYRSRSPARRDGGGVVGGGSHGINNNMAPGFGGGHGYHQEYAYQQEPQAYPITDIDLGGRDDTRFFVVKSNDVGNIWMSHEDCIWATSSVEKGAVLASAFENCKNVVLFFSANKSGAFQGYVSPHEWTPSHDLPKPHWYRSFTGFHRMSEPFEIEWLSKNVCPDTRMKSLQNRLNRDEQTGIYLPPTRARDCQEIDADCGRAMIQILQADVLGRMD
ncbi:uncharacterized protein PG998_013066 [Apiospora kogelbergensis]|uniref:uncharacterized protein n=1 Tax=Apiospora kogelbergensis TaxID=1337665 RepID=UPI00312F0BB8